MGEYWLTTLSAIRAGHADWSAITAYEVPVRRYLARRFPGLDAAERDDLVQEVLLAMRERIVPAYDARRGRFRSLLVSAVANKARDLLKRARPGALTSEPADDAPSVADLDAIDLEALIVQAVRAVHDQATAGPEPDLELVWVLSGVLVHGRSGAEVARREELSVDQVKRRLQEARAAILGHVLRELLGPDALPGRVARAAELARGCLRDPRAGSRALEDEPDLGVQAAVRGLVDGLRGLSARAGRGSDPGELDLLRGVEAVLAGTAA